VLPGFAPAGEVVAWRVSKGATFVVGQKGPITVALFETHQATVMPRLASLERTDASLRRADQLAELRQGPPADESVPPWVQTASVRPWETEHFRDSHERARSPIFCMIQDFLQTECLESWMERKEGRLDEWYGSEGRSKLWSMK